MLMNLMKKIFWVFSLAIISFGILSPVLAQNGWGAWPANSGIPNSFTVGDSNVTGGFNVGGGTDTDQGDSIITVVKNIINYALGFLGLIVLVMLLYGGFNMVTAGADDEKYKEGFKILKNAAIGIWFIGLAWFFVSFIFYVFELVAGT